MISHHETTITSSIDERRASELITKTHWETYILSFFVWKTLNNIEWKRVSVSFLCVDEKWMKILWTSWCAFSDDNGNVDSTVLSTESFSISHHKKPKNIISSTPQQTQWDQELHFIFTMSKRINVNGQMRKEEYEALQEKESGGLQEGFQTASAEVLKKRRILRVSK